MKKWIKVLSILGIATLLVTSCSKDNDPSDDNLFVGTYKGAVSYSDPDSETTITTDDGRVTLVKVDNSYNFDFSDGIPNLTGIKMEKNQNTLVSSDGAISIDEGLLIIDFSKGGETWGADCTR